ncbi:epoxyqueuosine reductase QueH [Chitinispirillales bacterium ANBcel5]|uniref:epoxyqueuosine reductase QueH n=1 Tax=Cellulosispirillum alkaliphilum TaxID=3039283 RepID=UPI002A558394|nr:epoxyqueuosine reductase QueH [Chitinispirillales bacterium ANBcel5]
MSVLPKIVLHICCAPDEAYVINLLRAEYQLHCFFCNHNIYPVTEYELRFAEAQKVAERYNIPFSADSYEPSLWTQVVKDLENTPEGGQRCRECFLLRLRRTASFCKNLGWSAFTSVMSVSPHKNITMLNETGALAAREQEMEYIPFNFKKKDGFRKSIALSNSLGLYRQDYCGCQLSLKERNIRLKEKLFKKDHS